MTPDGHIAERHIVDSLSLDEKASALQGDRQRVHVDLLQKPEAERIVDVVECADDRTRQFIVDQSAPRQVAFHDDTMSATQLPCTISSPQA